MTETIRVWYVRLSTASTIRSVYEDVPPWYDKIYEEIGSWDLTDLEALE